MKRILLAALLAAFSCQLYGQTVVTGAGGFTGGTVTSPVISNVNTTALTGGFVWNGTVGTSTNAYPALYLKQATATDPTFNTNGVMQLVNVLSGFTGDVYKLYNNGSTKITFGANGSITSTNAISGSTFATATNCASAGGTCSSAAAGRVSIAAAATTVTVATGAVTAASEILVSRDDSLGTALSVTCNTQSSLVLGTPRVTARTAGTSFVITIDVAPTTNPMCLSYTVIN